MPKKNPRHWIPGLTGEDNTPDSTEDRLRHLDSLDSIGNFTAIADRRGRLQFANTDPVKALGYSEDEILQKPFWEAAWFSPSKESQRTIKEGILDALDGEGVECRVQAFAKDGTALPVTFNITPLKGSEGSIVAIVAETEPLDEEGHAAGDEEVETRDKSSGRLDSLLDIMQEAYFETDAADKLTTLNQAAAKLLQYTKPEEILGTRASEFWADAEERDRFLMQLSRKGKVDGFRASLLRSDGTKIPVEMRARLLLGASEEPAGSQVTFAEIGKRQDIQEPSTGGDGAYFKFIQTLTDVVYVLDLQGKFTYVNPQGQRTIGYSFEDLAGRPFTDILAPEDMDRVLSYFKKGLSGHDTPAYEVEVIHKNGNRIPLELHVTSLVDGQGKNIGRIGVARDIRNRKKTEAALQEAERRYRAIFDNPLNMVFINDGLGTFLDANEAALQRFGLTKNDLGKISFGQLVHPDDLAEVIGALDQVKSKGYMDKPVTVRTTGKSGETIWLEVFGFPIEQDKKHYLGLAMAVDITERKKAEEALRESEERHRLITDTISDIIWTADLNLKLTYMSPSIYRQKGYTVEEAMALPTYKHWAPKSVERVMETFTEQMELEKTGKGDPHRWIRLEVEILRKDGSTYWGELSATFLRDNEGHATGILAVTRDIDERKRAEEALRKADKRYHAVTSNPLNCVFVANEQGIMTEANEATMKFLDLSQDDLGIANILSFVHPEDLPMAATSMTEAIARGHGDPIQVRVISKSGRRAWVEVYSNELEVEGDRRLGIGIFHDITERKKAAEALRQSEAKLKDLVEKLSLSQEALSTPVVQIWHKVLALPLIGVIDDQRAQQIMEVVLRKIVETQSEVLIMDVTGVASMDTTVTNHLVRTVQSASMLGAKCVLTGIRPEVAHTVTSLGVDMSQVVVKRDLQDGLRWALQNLGITFGHGLR